MSKPIKQLKGTKGILIKDNVHGGMYFRFTDENGKIVDCDIIHYDISITIDDEDAYLYLDSNDEPYIDYGPETLGEK